jgi:hypothetical protein
MCLCVYERERKRERERERGCMRMTKRKLVYDTPP